MSPSTAARVFAYCRVSTADQSPENQALEIASAGFNIAPPRIVTETVSGSVPAEQRREFVRLMDRLEEGDILVVTKLDRLGRNAMDVRTTVERLAKAKVRVHCLALGGADLTSAAGKMTMQVIAAVAEFERDLLVERTLSGLARAISQGKHVGRPAALDEKTAARIRARLAKGETVSALAREHDVSRTTIQRIQRGANSSDGQPLLS